MPNDEWGFSALLPPERLAALERTAPAAFAESSGLPELAPPIPPPAPPVVVASAAPAAVAAPLVPAAPAAVTAPVAAAPAPAAIALPAALPPPAPPPPPAPLGAVPPAPVALPATVPPARRSLVARLGVPAGVAVTAAGLAGLVASVAGPARIGPVAVRGPAAYDAAPGSGTSGTDGAALGAAGARAAAGGARPATPTARPAGTPAGKPSSKPAGRPAGPRPLARSRPLVVEAPRLGLRADVTELGLRPDGSLDVPADARVSGWYAGGPAPGQRGAAVVVGHVDSTAGPAVFHPLLGARAGDEVVVHRADGTRVVFRVYRVAAYPKTSFPTDLVYRADGTELRLVTCSGEFDRRTRHYRDNLVVFARRVG